MDIKRYQWKTNAILLGISIIGITALYWGNAKSIGASPDSAHYIDCAENIIKGKGYSTYLYNYLHPISIEDYIKISLKEHNNNPMPETHFPPLFSIFIAFLMLFGLNGLSAARLMILILFGLNIYMVGITTARYCQNSFFFSILAALMMLGSESMLAIHSNALSEPLYIFLGLTALLFLSKFIDSGKYGSLIIGSAAIGLVTLSRYIGVTLTAAALVGISLMRHQTWRRKILDNLALMAISLLPISIFVGRNMIIANTEFNRHVSIQSLNFIETIRSSFLTLSSWLIPGSNRFKVFPGQMAITSILTFTIIIAFCSLGYILILKKIKENPKKQGFKILNKTPISYALYIFVYIGFLIISIHFIDKSSLSEMERMLSPIFGPSLIVSLYMVYCLLKLIKNKVRHITKIVLTFYCVAYVLSGIAWIYLRHSRGIGYSNKYWSSPPIQEAFQVLKKFPISMPIFSNDSASIYIYAQRYAYHLNPASFLNKPHQLKEAIIKVPLMFMLFKSEAHKKGIQSASGYSLEEIAKNLGNDKNIKVLICNEYVCLFKTIPFGPGQL
jgi:hypothetical protein